MIKFLKNSGWALYLGFMLGHYGLGIDTLAFWIICIPTVILVDWSSNKKE